MTSPLLPKPLVLKTFGAWILPFFFCATILPAQTADSIFKKGSQLAFNSQYDSAIVLIKKACAMQPKDMDMRLTLGRVYAWKREYFEAETNVKLVLNNQPNNREAMTVLADVYLWSNNWSELDNLTKNALVPSKNNNNPNTNTVTDSVAFIQRFAAGLTEQLRYYEAKDVLKPFKEKLPKLWDLVIYKLLANTVSIHLGYYEFKTQQPDWQTAEIEYIRKLRGITIVGSLNYAARFGKQGTQLMVQAYPKIGNRSYLWLILGLSEGVTFPDQVYGASFFNSFKKNWEGEIGIRLFKTKNGESATILRGGIAYTKKQHRFNYIIAKVQGTGIDGLSHNLSYRNYYKNDESYLQVGIGTGSSTQTLSVLQDNFIVNAHVANVLANHWFTHNWRGFGGISWEENQNPNDGTWAKRWIYEIGIGFRF